LPPCGRMRPPTSRASATTSRAARRIPVTKLQDSRP
jgi:hypothetical protein